MRSEIITKIFMFSGLIVILITLAVMVIRFALKKLKLLFNAVAEIIETLSYICRVLATDENCALNSILRDQEYKLVKYANKLRRVSECRQKH